ncbi:ATP-grasp domain-containing protein [Kribbella endophytica]
MEYPQPTALYPDERSVKSAELVGYLNNKASISTFVDPRFQARRQIVTIDELAEAIPAEKSWVLKAATNAAHGASLDVYLHRAGDPVVLPAFTGIVTEVVVEEYLDIHRNWGVQLYVAADGRARLLAVTDQRIDADGVYTGGRFGLIVPLPADLLTECLAIAQRAADVGYRGMCSLDCAQTYDGGLVMLDLNFRITSGSIPLLALHTIRPDALDSPSESTKLTTTASIATLLAELRPVLQRGGLIVTGGHDTRRTDNTINQTTLHLIVFGDDPDDVTTRRTKLEALYNH